MPTFGDRCKVAHFKGFCTGENVLNGATTPKQAYDMWFNSAPHKANMLGNSATIGVAKVGRFWTQVFGGDGEGEVPNC
jgi:uncharacterized protein YkwD